MTCFGFKFHQRVDSKARPPKVSFISLPSIYLALDSQIPLLYFSRAEISCNVPDYIVTDPFSPITPASFRDARSLGKSNLAPASGTKNVRDPINTQIDQFESRLFAVRWVFIQ